MKIKITEDCLVNGEHTAAGTEVEIEDVATVNQLLMSGRAQAAEPEQAREGGAMVAETPPKPEEPQPAAAAAKPEKKSAKD